LGDGEASARAVAWRRDHLTRICDVYEPWEHGIIARASRYPDYYEFNLLVVAEEPELTVDELVQLSDRALAGLRHRRIDFEDVAAGDARRAEFEARGWRAMRLLWMRHESPVQSAETDVEVVEVSYEAADELRRRWDREDFPGQDPGDYPAQAREVSERRGVQVLAVRNGDHPIAFAQLERAGDAAEITHVYVDPDHRGRGRGTAMTTAAIHAAADVRDLWITANDEGRAKHLYARLGFVPAARTMELTLWPQAE
jgi:ribosomal protein S18 acetylase RimI-like enzyme